MLLSWWEPTHKCNQWAKAWGTAVGLGLQSILSTLLLEPLCSSWPYLWPSSWEAAAPGELPEGNESPPHAFPVGEGLPACSCHGSCWWPAKWERLQTALSLLVQALAFPSTLGSPHTFLFPCFGELWSCWQEFGRDGIAALLFFSKPA